MPEGARPCLFIGGVWVRIGTVVGLSNFASKEKKKKNWFGRLSEGGEPHMPVTSITSVETRLDCGL